MVDFAADGNKGTTKHQIAQLNLKKKTEVICAMGII